MGFSPSYIRWHYCRVCWNGWCGRRDRQAGEWCGWVGFSSVAALGADDPEFFAVQDDHIVAEEVAEGDVVAAVKAKPLPEIRDKYGLQ